MAFSNLNTLVWKGAAGSAATATTGTVVIDRIDADGAVTVTDGADKAIATFTAAGSREYKDGLLVRGLKRDDGAGNVEITIR